MKMNIIYIAFILMSLAACEDNMPPIEPPPPIEKELFDLQWATRMNPDKEIVNLNDGQEYKDWFIYSGDIDDPPTLLAFNKVSGNLDWEYTHEGNVNLKINNSIVVNNIYFGCTGDGIIAFDLDLQMIKWELDYRNFDIYSNWTPVYFNESIYLTIEKGGVGLNSKSAAFVKIDNQTGEFEEVYESVNDEEGLKSLSPIATSHLGDNTIIYFNERPNAGITPPDVRQELVAYDITNQVEIWRVNVTDGFASNGLHPPIIYEDLVITGGDWSMYAFDIHTGEQKWKTEISPESPVGNWTKTNHLIYDDRLYVNQTEFHITCLNPLTGDIIWDSLEAPNCTDNMLYYEKEDYLVFTSWGYGSVMVLDALTGETVHREHRYDESQYNNDVVYDEELDMFFTSTYKHAVGFKINAPE